MNVIVARLSAQMGQEVKNFVHQDAGSNPGSGKRFLQVARREGFKTAGSFENHEECLHFTPSILYIKTHVYAHSSVTITYQVYLIIFREYIHIY